MITGQNPLAQPAQALIFTGESVRAIGAGSKTQTRRLFTRGNKADGTWWSKESWEQLDFGKAWVDPGPSPAGNPGPYLKVPGACEAVHRVYPRYFVGERLYVKEAWGVAGAWAVDPCLTYRADGAQQPIDPRFMISVMNDQVTDRLAGKRQRVMRWHESWRSPVLMPRWAARYVLEVTLVRIERVQDISYDDAVAEGIDHHYPQAIADYRQIWDAMHDTPGTTWADNPWVTAYTFHRLTTDGK